MGQLTTAAAARPHCSSLLMSHGVAANTPLAGAAIGNFLDDLTNRMAF